MGFSLGGILGGIGAALNPVSLIGTVGAAALGGGLDFLGQQQTNEANATNVRDTNALNYQMAQQQMQMEKEFAQNGISWRVADAARNNISPLAALGASEPGYSPVSPVFSTSSYSSPLSTVSPHLESMGQNISRAIMAQQSPMEKQLQQADLAWKTKQNDILDVQLANAKLDLARKSSPPGIPSAYMQVRNRDGSLMWIPTPDVAMSLHGMNLGPTQWSLANKLMPHFQGWNDPEEDPGYYRRGRSK